MTSTTAGMVNAFVADADIDLPATDRALIGRRQAALGSAYRLFYQRPVHPVRGKGCWLYDADDNAYLDVYNNVASVGHCHPHVVAALTKQAETLNTHTRYLDDIIVDYAERLLATLPDSIAHAMFTCTGSEANDLAMRIAQHATGGEGIVVTELAYHGVASAVAAFSPSLGVVPAPDAYRGDPDVGAAFAAAVRAAFADLQRHGIRPAAFICDTIFSSDGVFADPAGFLKGAVEAAHEAGALFVADEVQPGFGRTGAGMWGFARHGVVPDIVTAGKPMGNGHPIAGVFARADIVDAFGQNLRYFNTFGGNRVSCAVGMAVLDVIEGEGLIENARVTGELLLDGFRDLATRHDVIGDVRGAGLFVGVEMVANRETREPSAEAASHLVNALREKRILISATGPGANILKVRPPLVFGPAEAAMLLEAVDEILSEG